MTEVFFQIKPAAGATFYLFPQSDKKFAKGKLQSCPAAGIVIIMEGNQPLSLCLLQQLPAFFLEDNFQ